MNKKHKEETYAFHVYHCGDCINGHVEATSFEDARQQALEILDHNMEIVFEN